MKLVATLIASLISNLALATVLQVEFESYDPLARSNELYKIGEFRCNGFTGKNNITTYFLLHTGNGGDSEASSELRGADSSVPGSLKIAYFQEFVNGDSFDTNEGETVFVGASTTNMDFAGKFKLKINKVKKSSAQSEDNLWSGTLEVSSASPAVNSHGGVGSQTVTCASYP